MLVFRHPKYYKELRRAGVQVNSSRPAHSRCNKSDQTISASGSYGLTKRVRPGPGQTKKATSSKSQATSNKHKSQATSNKPQASED